MTPSSYQRWMAETTRLTRDGDLQGATARIRAALGAAVAHPADAGTCVLDVIDVEAREVDIDIETPAPAREAPAAPAFIGGSYTHPRAGTRDHKLFVPPARPGQALPLVVMLHGCGQDPDDFAAGTRMNAAALERGFFVLYPAQAAKANPSRCWNWFKHNHQRRDQGEPALLAGMVQEVTRRHPIDPARVYVAGLSAGGAMAAILGAAYPDVFAAVGVHSGLPCGAANDLPSALAAMKSGASGAAPGRTPPTVVFHGDQDGTVHPVNGGHVAASSAGGAAPELERARSDNGHAYTRRIYRDASGRVITEHWDVHGSGHAWSGGSARGSYTDPRGPDATREMLRFFFSHSLQPAG